MKKQFAVYKVKASVEKILSVQKELSAIDKNISAEFTAHRDPQVWATAPEYWPDSDSRIAEAKKIMSHHFESSQAAAALGSIKSAKKAASSRENGKKGGRPKKDRITIYLDAGTDLSVACLPDSRKDIEKFEREYKRAAKQYAKEHDMIIDVETDPTAPLPANYDEERHTEIWQAIHNMIPN